MIQRNPFSYPTTATEIQRLERRLRFLLSAHAINFPPSLAVANIACGRADETGALARALEPSKFVFYLGLDLRTHCIREAQERWENPHGSVTFLDGNAATLGRMETLPHFDLIFIRHQNYWNEPMVWEGILSEAIASLKPEGYLICTSYFDQEHELLLATLKQRDLRCLVNDRNPLSMPLKDAEGKSVDRWIAIFQR